MIQVELYKIIIDEKRQDQVIILREKDGKRQLPIVIGLIEASSIKMKLAEVEIPRPLTHDLLKSLIEGLDAKVENIVIDKMVDSTFHAKINLTTKDGETKTVDARPSDSIALAVRMGIPIFVKKEVFDKAALFSQE